MSVSEIVAEHSFEYESNCWMTKKQEVVLHPRKIDEGSCRDVFALSRREGEDSVVKLSKDPTVGRHTYFDEVEMQAKCASLAAAFNSCQPPKKVTFIVPTVMEFPKRKGITGLPLVVIAEPKLKGKYEKYSNNFGWQMPNCRNTPLAFSHFTYHFTAGKLLVCDIQGVHDIYTDPTIHSNTMGGGVWGPADLGADGIRKFFQTHKCNSVCAHIGLGPLQHHGGTTPIIHRDEEVRTKVERPKTPSTTTRRSLSPSQPGKLLTLGVKSYIVQQPSSPPAHSPPPPPYMSPPKTTAQEHSLARDHKSPVPRVAPRVGAYSSPTRHRQSTPNQMTRSQTSTGISTENHPIHVKNAVSQLLNTTENKRSPVRVNVSMLKGNEKRNNSPLSLDSKPTPKYFPKQRFVANLRKRNSQDSNATSCSTTSDLYRAPKSMSPGNCRPYTPTNEAVRNFTPETHIIQLAPSSPLKEASVPPLMDDNIPTGTTHTSNTTVGCCYPTTRGGVQSPVTRTTSPSPFIRHSDSDPIAIHRPKQVEQQQQHSQQCSVVPLDEKFQIPTSDKPNRLSWNVHLFNSPQSDFNKTSPLPSTADLPVPAHLQPLDSTSTKRHSPPTSVVGGTQPSPYGRRRILSSDDVPAYVHRPETPIYSSTVASSADSQNPKVENQDHKDYPTFLHL